MSVISSLSTENSLLAQRLENAEKSIDFIQREHESTLTNLHNEITKWQQKCADLTFQLLINGITVSDSCEYSKIRDTAKQLEINVQDCQNKIKNLEISLEEKENLINDYEHRLTVSERKHALELQAQYAKQRDLRTELQQRSALVTQLTSQLQREKQNPSNRIRVGQIILPNRPTKTKTNDEQQQQLPSTHRFSCRSSSLNNRIITNQELAKVLFIGRRPPTPPQQLQCLSTKILDSTDEQLCTKRQRQLVNNTTANDELLKFTSVRSSNKLSPVLPSIINRKLTVKALNTSTATTFQREGEA